MSLRDFVLHNFWLKLFSLVLATLIWFAIDFGIKSGRRPAPSLIKSSAVRQSFMVPVSVLAQPGDARVFGIDPRQVQVLFTGDAAVLQGVNTKDISAFIDLSGVRSSRETNQLVRVNVPSGVTIIEIVPRTVNIDQISP